MKNTIFCFLGKSGSGKSEIAKLLDIPEIRSCTTRKKRSSENGTEYYFISKLKFLWKVLTRQLAEYNKYSKHYYGIEKEELVGKLQESDVCAVVTVEGFRQLKKEFPDNVEAIFINTSENKVKERMIKRGDDIYKIEERIQNSRKTKESENWKNCDYVVSNDSDDIMKAVKEIKYIIRPNVILDIDSTVLETIERWISLYNYRHGTGVDWTKVRKWNFSGVLNIEDKSEIENIFQDDYFYDLNYINFAKDAIESIAELSKLDCNLKFLTVGGANNNRNKIATICSTFKNIDFISITQNSPIMNKSIINGRPRDFIFDDFANNLYTMTAGNKVLCECHHPMDYNKHWKGERKNWKEFVKYVKDTLDK